MAIRLGDYRTRGGRRAVVLCNDAPGHWPVVGYVASNAETIHPRVWRDDGRMLYSMEQPDDLIVVTPSPTVTIVDEGEVSA